MALVGFDSCYYPSIQRALLCAHKVLVLQLFPRLLLAYRQARMMGLIGIQAAPQ